MNSKNSFPKKKNTAFIKAIATKFPDINLDFGREEGYSIYLEEIPNKRWMMVDMNDSPNEATPELIIAIDIKTNDIREEDIEILTQIPLRKKGQKETSFWLTKNRDSIRLRFCQDEHYAYDFEKGSFLDFVERTYISFKSR
ncbi:hypothetical protein [Lentibacillus cibarius]|uniref:Uncharacterized protein n=1 Tax=Lentibacillus cibarius TaxID=2583219 RepID=A0A5S3QII6_9BACI|nr:hypothetical protein [Lentibacillus cibarius]TMN21734.1 hypothetical protein FFL34_06095 [Lentibacillus cibarius]